MELRGAFFFQIERFVWVRFGGGMANPALH
jgi:hypothetical protein